MPQRRGDSARHDIRVDIQHHGGVPLIHAEAADHRHERMREQQLEQARVDRRRIADEAEIDLFARGRSVRPGATRPSERRIHPRQSDRPHAGGHEGRDQLGVRRAGEHRDDGVERLRVGHPQALHFPRRNAAALQLGINRAAAPVHHDEGPRARNRRREPRQPCPAFRRFQELAADLQHESARPGRCRRPGVSSAGHSSAVRSSNPHATLKF